MSITSRLLFNCIDSRRRRNYQMVAKYAAFTLVEMLVAIAIVSVLMGITIVSVSSMRESSRRVHCQNNLRQIALGMLNFESARGHLPEPRMNFGGKSSGSPDIVVGAFVAIVPFLEIPEDMIYDEEHMPAVFQCPTSHDGLSYRINVGPLRVLAGEVYEGNGIVKHKRDSYVTMSSVSDGLSNTVAVSERVSTGNIVQIPDSIFTTRIYHDMLSMQFSCLNEADSQVGLPASPEKWTSWSTQHYGYDHWSSPNSRFIDCQGTNGRVFIAQLVASRSRHAGGVLSVKLDGSVIWSADSIDNLVWRSLGTRSSDESRWANW